MSTSKCFYCTIVFQITAQVQQGVLLTQYSKVNCSYLHISKLSIESALTFSFHSIAVINKTYIVVQLVLFVVCF